jgi:hypothetical protein
MNNDETYWNLFWRVFAEDMFKSRGKNRFQYIFHYGLTFSQGHIRADVHVRFSVQFTFLSPWLAVFHYKICHSSSSCSQFFLLLFWLLASLLFILTRVGPLSRLYTLCPAFIPMQHLSFSPLLFLSDLFHKCIRSFFLSAVQFLISELFIMSKRETGHAIAQMASCRSSTAAPPFRSQVRSCGICGGEVGTGQVFCEYFSFPCQLSFHQLLSIH